MRKVVYGINLTADGCCEHTKVNNIEGIHEYFTSLFAEVDLIVYGRKTYELMVPYWPDVAKNQSDTPVANEFAKAFDAIDKVVFSKTLNSVPSNTKLIRGNLEAEVLKLKQQPGKNISIGGVNLPSQLVALGLVDEFYFVVHPTFAGEGKRLFDGIGFKEQPQLKLVSTEQLKSGAIALHYVKH